MATTMSRAPADPSAVGVVELRAVSPPAPDDALEAALRDRDYKEAVRLLMLAYGDAVYRFALKKSRSTAAAEDIRQRVFVEAFRDLGAFEGRSSLQAWLFGIARNRCIDEGRRTQKWTKRFKNDAPGDLAIDEPSPDDELDRQHLIEVLRSCLGKLAPAAREAVTLRFLEQMSYTEISKLIDDLPTTLQRRVSRALPQLRRCLDAQTGRDGSSAGPSNARFAAPPLANGTNPSLTCDRFWRDGVLLAEAGESDPHRDECAACRVAHEEYLELIELLPLVDRDERGSDGWELRVWRQIAVDTRTRRLARLLAPVAAAAAVLVLWLFMRPDQTDAIAGRPYYEVESRTAMRSTSAHVGDRVRVFASPGEEVRVYRSGELILRCPAHVATIGCIPDDHGTVAHVLITAMGRYQIIVANAPSAAWIGTLDADRAAIADSHGTSTRFEFSVR